MLDCMIMYEGAGDALDEPLSGLSIATVVALIATGVAISATGVAIGCNWGCDPASSIATGVAFS
ncbi:hypothetical protein D3C78_1939320 [compost metagenome]